MPKLWFNGNGNYYVLFILGGVIGLSFILTNGLLPNIKPNDTLEERVSELRTPASTDNESLQMSNIGFDPQSITVVPPSPTEGQIEENSIINPTTQPQITVIAANPNSTTTTPPINSSPTVSTTTTSNPTVAQPTPPNATVTREYLLYGLIKIKLLTLVGVGMVILILG